ncbi:hypothetical protein [Amycolatopsis albispora]|uniref:Uncharacterized protein n=1 Tax=Amycolatopsis albispora TaxID=1804986 RepID=A0A344LIH3_9PSEU|nr:hypothetical protein [Amycolatopsis albispora]AXB47847.1 hypothetical protein A4R43_39845 [Amycolatopsis albispora]
MGFFKRLFGDRLPEDFAGELAAGEDALATAKVTGGGYLVVTQFGLWVPEGGEQRRIGWHLISKAAWAEGSLTVTEAEETGQAGGAVLLTDRAPVRFGVESPGKVPPMVRQRVDGSIRARHRQELPGGGAWFLRRKVPGTDGTVLQVRADPGVDADLVAAIAEDAVKKLVDPEA